MQIRNIFDKAGKESCLRLILINYKNVINIRRYEYLTLAAIILNILVIKACYSMTCEPG